MSKASGSKVALWVALGILGLIVLGGIVLFAIAFTFMRSEQGQKFSDTIGTLNRIEHSAPDIIDAIRKYIEVNKEFPDSIDDAKALMEPDSFKLCEDLFTYRKPNDDDPDTTPILWTGDLDMIMGGKVRIEILKDFTAQQVQIMPLPLEERPSEIKKE